MVICNITNFCFCVLYCFICLLLLLPFTIPKKKLFHHDFSRFLNGKAHVHFNHLVHFQSSSEESCSVGIPLEIVNPILLSQGMLKILLSILVQMSEKICERFLGVFRTQGCLQVAILHWMFIKFLENYSNFRLKGKVEF